MGFHYPSRTIGGYVKADGASIKNIISGTVLFEVPNNNTFLASALAAAINAGLPHLQEVEARHDADESYRAAMILRANRKASIEDAAK